MKLLEILIKYHNSWYAWYFLQVWKICRVSHVKFKWIVSRTIWTSVFLIHKLILQADPNTDVRGRMINAGIMIIDKHGRESVSLLFPIFENYLNKKVFLFMLEQFFFPKCPFALSFWGPKFVYSREPSVLFRLKVCCKFPSIWYSWFPNFLGIRWREIWFDSWGCCYIHWSTGETFGYGIAFS